MKLSNLQKTIFVIKYIILIMICLKKQTIMFLVNRISYPDYFDTSSAVFFRFLKQSKFNNQTIRSFY